MAHFKDVELLCTMFPQTKQEVLIHALENSDTMEAAVDSVIAMQVPQDNEPGQRIVQREAGPRDADDVFLYNGEEELFEQQAEFDLKHPPCPYEPWTNADAFFDSLPQPSTKIASRYPHPTDNSADNPTDYQPWTSKKHQDIPEYSITFFPPNEFAATQSLLQQSKEAISQESGGEAQRRGLFQDGESPYKKKKVEPTIESLQEEVKELKGRMFDMDYKHKNTIKSLASRILALEKIPNQHAFTQMEKVWNPPPAPHKPLVAYFPSSDIFGEPYHNHKKYAFAAPSPKVIDPTPVVKTRIMNWFDFTACKTCSNVVSFNAIIPVSSTTTIQEFQQAVDEMVGVKCDCGKMVCAACGEVGENDHCKLQTVLKLQLALVTLEFTQVSHVDSQAMSNQPSSLISNQPSKGVGYGGDHGHGGIMTQKYRAQDLDFYLDIGLSTAKVLLPSVNRWNDYDLEPPATLMNVLEKSSLHGILAELFRNDSLSDVAKRFHVYKLAFDVLLTIASHPKTVEFVKKDTVNLVDLMNFQVEQAENFKKHLVDSNGATKVDLDPETTQSIYIAAEMAVLAQRITEAYSTHGFKMVENVEKVAKSVDQYAEELKPLVYADATFAPPRLNTGQNSKKMVHVLKELASLEHNLPCSAGAAMFVRYDDSNLDNGIRFLVSGPQGTPYQDGLWVFDVRLPSQYPNQPPIVKNLTTGYGRVRFNPNLYNDGKVCLSILGTWNGPSWIPGESTLLQVFISIQSMILGVEDPYRNEPGYSKISSSNPQVSNYNQEKRLETVRWAMIEHLRKPPVGFEEVVKRHFKLKKDAILQCVENWKSMDPNRSGQWTPLIADLTNLLPV
jgi:ubiquitin-protein ligase